MLGSKRAGEYPVLKMGEDRAGGEDSLGGGRVRRQIPFDNLPGVRRAAVLDAYRRLWDL